jgi:archaellin
VLLGVLAIAATPAMANRVDTANVAADCTKFTIVVSGAEINEPNAAVTYTITVTPTVGAPITITDTIPVVPDASLNFSAAVSVSG